MLGPSQLPLDSTVEELRTALEGGQSLAAAVESKGVATQTLVDALSDRSCCCCRTV